jgi:hypothetical protein
MAPGTALAGAQDDAPSAELLRLIEAHRAAHGAYTWASARQSEAERSYNDIRPSIPFVFKRGAIFAKVRKMLRCGGFGAFEIAEIFSSKRGFSVE